MQAAGLFQRSAQAADDGGSVPSMEFVYTSLSETLIRLKQFAEARDVLRHAKSPQAIMNLGQVHLLLAAEELRALSVCGDWENRGRGGGMSCCSNLWSDALPA